MTERHEVPAQPVEASNDLDPEAAAVVTSATRLVDDLQHRTRAGVFGAVLELQRVLADLETVERGKYEQELREAIEHAAGLALTHEWQLVDSGIRCARCPVDAGVLAVTRGAVPACNPKTRCAPFAPRHFIVSTGCIYCKAEYPATAGDGGDHR